MRSKFLLVICFAMFFVLTVGLASAQTSIYRAPIEKNNETNTTNVRLGIVSSERTLVVQEMFSSPACSVLSFSVFPEIAFADVNPHLGLWLFGNNSSSLNIEVNYTLPYECGVINGSYYVLSGSGVITDGLNNVSSGTGSGSGSGSGSGGSVRGSGGGGSISVPISVGSPNTPLANGINQTNSSVNQVVYTLQTDKIVQTTSQEEYNRAVRGALERLLGLSSSQKIDIASFVGILILIVVAALLAIIFLISFLKKPQSYEVQAK